MIRVKQILEQNLSLGRYFTVELETAKAAAIVCVDPCSVRVIVQNAAHKAYRGMGKHFANEAAALANYKRADIRAMIAHAVELARIASQTATAIH